MKTSILWALCFHTKTRLLCVFDPRWFINTVARSASRLILDPLFDPSTPGYRSTGELAVELVVHLPVSLRAALVIIPMNVTLPLTSVILKS